MRALNMAGLLLLCVCAYNSEPERVYLPYRGKRSADVFETAERSQSDPSVALRTASEMLAAV